MTGSTATVNYEIPEAREPDTPRMRFTINGEPFAILMPKIGTAVNLLALMDREAEVPPMQYALQLAQAIWGLIDYIEDAPPEPGTLPNPDWNDGDDESVPERVVNPNAGQLHGRARILQRLNNPRDSMDVQDLAPILARCVNVMFQNERPTGPLSESSGAQGNGGSGSAAGSSDEPGATS